MFFSVYLEAIFGKKKLCPLTEETEQTIEWLKISHVTRVTCPTFSMGHVSLDLKKARQIFTVLENRGGWTNKKER